MENINIKVTLDEVFGKSCDSITYDTCKYKEDCTLINKFIIKMANQSVDNNKQENKFKNVSDDEIYAELKRRKANKSAK